MAFIGNTPTQQAFTAAVDVFSGNGSTTAFTLSRPVASVAQVEAVIENVQQSPVDAYTVVGNTPTFTSAPPSGSSNIYVRYTSPITQVIAPTDGTVGTSQLAAGAVTSAKMAAGAARANFGAGAVLQVVSVANTSTGSGTSNTFLDIVTGVSITPSSTSSKILLTGQLTLTFMSGDEFFVKMQVSVNGGSYSDVGSNSFGNMPAHSAGYTATGVNWQIMTVPVHFLYSPATTSPLTFKIQATGQNAGGTTFYYNRTGGASGTDSGSAISALTALEIAG